jgi:hypothetical protein
MCEWVVVRLTVGTEGEQTSVWGRASFAGRLSSLFQSAGLEDSLGELIRNV